MCHSTSSAGLPVLLGLLAAASWGAADFSGGLATRRAPPSLVVLIAHGVSVVLLAVASAAMPAQLTSWATTGALLSGVVGGAALMVFYEALSLGVMGLSAALAGLLTALLPVLVSLRTEGLPSTAQWAGFGLAAVAIVLIAYAPPAAGTRTSRRALLFAVIGGLGFGLQLVWLHTAAATGATPHRMPRRVLPSDGLPRPSLYTAALAPVLRALTLSRLGGAGVAVAVRGAAYLRHTNRVFPPATEAATRLRWLPLPALAVLAGLLDTGGNGLYMLASVGGRLDVAAVLSSLYPAGTIVLASLVLRERTTRLQAAGMALALGAVAFIAS